MREERVGTEKEKGQKVKRPQGNLQMARIAFKGTGTYTDPPAAVAAEEEKGA